MPTFGLSRSRALAELGRLPAPNDVAVADIVNYHRHRLPLPRAGEDVALDVRFGSATTTADGSAVLQIGITTASVGDRRDLPPLNLVLVIDCSGSMADDDKLEEVGRALHVLAGRLRPSDRVAVVTYADSASLLAGSRRRGEGDWLDALIDGLQPGGHTNLCDGLVLGLREAADHAIENGSNRVILLTDGIANRGETDPGAILREARRYTSEGIDLSTIGVGTQLQTALLDELARGAHGQFHFVADARDVQKVFVDELESQLAAVGRRVRLVLDVPDELEIERLYGHDACARDGRLVLDLPDLNAAATAVVLAKCRVRSGECREDGLRVGARLEYSRRRLRRAPVGRATSRARASRCGHRTRGPRRLERLSPRRRRGPQELHDRGARRRHARDGGERVARALGGCRALPRACTRLRETPVPACRGSRSLPRDDDGAGLSPDAPPLPRPLSRRLLTACRSDARAAGGR